MSEAQKHADKQAAAQIVLKRKFIFRSLVLENPHQTQQQILEKSQMLLHFDVTQSALQEIEWELVEGPAVASLFSLHSRPKVSAVMALFKAKPAPSLADVVALFDENFHEGVAAVINLFNSNRNPACDDVIAMFNRKPWLMVEDVQRERERVRGGSWPPAFKTNAEWEFHRVTIMMLHNDPNFKSAQKIRGIMSHYPFDFMPKERVYNDKIKYWKVQAGQFLSIGAAECSSIVSPYGGGKAHRLSYDSGVDVRSQASSGRESRQSFITTTSTSFDSAKPENGNGNWGHGMPQQRAPLLRQLQTITESVKVDIDDEDLAGHTIINGYNPRDGELNIAANIVKYITAEYVKLEERDVAGDSLLHTAATIGLPLVVLALLHQGANPNSVNKKGQSIWFSTALAFESVERELSTQWEEGLQHQRGRLVDCLDLLERAPGFSTPHSSVPSISMAPVKDKVNFLHNTPQHYHVGHIQAAATSFKKVFWPW